MIAEVLSHGIENARTANEICGLLNIKKRVLTQAIENERRSGAPICATVGYYKGYFLAANQDEMQQYCGSLQRRLKEINRTRTACIKMIGDLPE